ncbi:hypothetical protein ACPA5B_11640 [Pseudomonas solani]|uniref:hypothetical protein n=1 Tax=Pseudomonas solani TaxID=2731552 RepID=UPI003C2D4F82
MKMSITLVGEEMARARLAAIGKAVEPVMRGALNTTGTRTRRDKYQKPMAKFIQDAEVRQRLALKRANSRRLNVRIIPSSSGVDVIRYKSWGFDIIDATRARVWVAGLNGKKIAAGFVNPSSGSKQPLSTRSSKARKVGPKTKNPQITSYEYARALQNAQAVSVAYWFKQLTNAGAIRWANAFLQQEFERRIRREIERATRGAK